MAESTVAGRYLLRRKIGEGGMGEVWEAEDVNLRRLVALKMLNQEQLDSDEARARFEREAMAIAQLRNPHVVQVHDYGINENSPYLVMEFLEGYNLQLLLEQRGRFPLSMTSSVIVQVARGLAAAHAVGIVHRDLKPANILLARNDTEDIAKILDFGVVSWGARKDQLAITFPGALIGTPAYMSPEQIRASRVDHRSDLWSLAVTSYALLTGKLPFDGRWMGQLVVRICSESFPRPSSLIPELPPAVDLFFERALAKDPAQRFQSAWSMANAFASLTDEGQSHTAKILVVDDEPDMILLVKQCFRNQLRDGTYEFIFAGDGERALEVLRDHPDIDIVLTDINMPRMDGLTLLKSLGELHPHVRVVVITAYGDMQNIRTAMNRGALDFLIKPLDPDDLVCTVDKVFKQVSALRKNARSGQENSLLKTFVSPLVVERLNLPDRFVPSTVEEGTVAFLDIAGFHEMTRERSPEEMVRLLNANFDVIVPELTMRGGVVSRFVGDALMVLFRGKDHLLTALDACLAVRSQLATLNLRAGAQSPFARALSIGVATGPIILAEIGSRSSRQLDYVTLGSVVSMAAQLEAMAKPNQILLCGTMGDEVTSSFSLVERECQSLAGARTPVQIFEVKQRHSPPTLREFPVPAGDVDTVTAEAPLPTTEG
ncbi:protein kinase domain-containing protein [Chondromyces crocatus]|uniref:Protein kinase n=1 Tax=Chondromyces crocatus TaxID=52 RepID=A0A0K1ECH2_CHOCO|nr:protein kinase [Chondromyces crocatus]AKT38392.1 protein kinase [Chondromyces crocatus]